MRPKASGSGQKQLTPKQKWLLANLDFLRPHVIHRATVSNLGMDSDATCATDEGSIEEGSEDPSAPHSDADVSNSSPALEEEEESSSNSSELSRSMRQPTQKPGMHNSDTKKNTSKKSEQNLEMVKLSLLKQVQSSLSQSDAEEQFGQQVAAEMRNVKDKHSQLRLRRSIMNLIYDAQEAEQAGQCPVPHVSPAPSFHMQQFQPPRNDNFLLSPSPMSYRHLLNSD
ncbi:uncharacterized protein [Nothobranchius furzeri]|uniref:uncharacterized protein n=1 Tax=Nothobranchius furzeri TaxID=105023 RepID=UPI003904DC20